LKEERSPPRPYREKAAAKKKTRHEKKKPNPGKRRPLRPSVLEKIVLGVQKSGKTKESEKAQTAIKEKVEGGGETVGEEGGKVRKKKRKFLS